MKGLYIARIDEKYSLDLGVAKKIKGQINAFNELGCEIDYLRLVDKRVKFNEKLFNKVKYRFFGCRYFYKLIKSIDKKDIEKYDYIYIRYVQGNISLYKIIKYLSKLDKKIIIEIPTYPYNTEAQSLNLRKILVSTLDKYITSKLYKYVFRIAVTNSYEKIFGIETIKINNGIDLKDLPLIESKQGDSLNLIGIANLARWHGYDRVIKGISNYYKKDINKENVNFYIIGEGSDKSNLMDITEELNIQDKVYFLGAKSGQELDLIFKDMHIGVSSLALFRAGGGHDPIKTKEFLGRGIPVLLGYKDRLVDMNLPYIIEVDENDEAIDIDNMIKKYRACENISNDEIRLYASENLSWKAQMRTVLKCIKNI